MLLLDFWRDDHASACYFEEVCYIMEHMSSRRLGRFGRAVGLDWRKG